MRQMCEVEIETVDGPAVFKFQALSAFKGMAGFNKLMKLLQESIVPNDVVNSVMKGLALLTEAQLKELCSLFLVGGQCHLNGSNNDVTIQKLDYWFVGNVGGIFVLLGHAIKLNYENFPNAFGQLSPMLKSLFPAEADNSPQSNQKM